MNDRYITKRNGQQVPFDSTKIQMAIRKSFASLQADISEEDLASILDLLEQKIINREKLDVEFIQDKVEQSLMEKGYFEVAKKYILYRQVRTIQRQERNELLELMVIEGLEEHLLSLQKTYPNLSLKRLKERYENTITGQEDRLSLLVRSAAELTSKEEPTWEKVAGRLLAFQLSLKLKQAEDSLGIHSFYEKLQYLTQEGLYGDYILKGYHQKEIEEAYHFIDFSHDYRFTYAGLDLLANRYLIHSRQHVILESPQEMYLGIALHLALKEKKYRMEWVKKFYDMLARHEVTMATPTLSNARKPYHQLSSCFIDTVPDSLDGIYQSIANFADVSKFGGGMGMYLGKVRSRGGMIRGFEGASGGVIRWIRVINDTAVAVDQLGVRQGAVAVYLDVWHKDLPEFLQLRTNNGDDRMKAHDVFPAICYPDLFWKKVKEDINQDWYFMDPHDIFVVKGYHLEDSYGEEWERKYEECIRDHRISKRVMSIKEVVRLILKSIVETGTPFAFYRDAVNRANPNKHAGIIYCSNLCTEIAQNMSEACIESRTIETRDGETVIVQIQKPGDFVVCNLASLCLGNINVNDIADLERVTSTAVRALDNVIDLNFYPLVNAKITNQNYRAIGLGVSGYHHMLAKNRIQWESEEHLQFVDRVFEDIAYMTIRASHELAKERGSYSLFKGSDWENGDYFRLRKYESERWLKLQKDIQKGGMRNAYVMAIAPTSSTSILIGTTAGLDPVLNRFFMEEKKGTMLPRTAPELSLETYWYYKSAHTIDQNYSIRANGIRQRHIDQSQSFNLWITNEYKMSQLLKLLTLAYDCGVKTIYYTRSKALDPEDCESCSA